MRERLEEAYNSIVEFNKFREGEDPDCLCGMCVGLRKLKEIIDELPQESEAMK